MSLLESRLFLREAEVIIGPKVTETNGATEPAEGRSFKKLRIRFAVEKSSQSDANKGKISIFNLSQDSRNFLDQENLVIFLKAGFKNTISTIFFGDVAKNGIRSKREGADIVTTIEAGDAEKILREANIQIGLGPGATNQQIIEQAALKLNVSTNIIKSFPTKQFLNGFSYSGPVRDLIDQQTKSIGFEWNIQDGEIQIFGKEDTDGQEAVLITPDTGLIGFPTKTQESVQFKSLLNPAIRPGRAIKLESKQFQGQLGSSANVLGAQSLIDLGQILKCRRAKFNGDTHEGPWEVEVEGVPVEVAV